MNAFAFSILFLATVLPSSDHHADAPALKYEISFPNIAHHEATIRIVASGLPVRPAHFVMSRTSPGRYAIHQFAKNVYRPRATDSNGNNLNLQHPTPHAWVVPEHSGTIQFEYDLFGDLTDGTYVDFDREHAHINIPATFMWIRDQHDTPISLRIKPAQPNWKVATQLQSTDDPFLFKAPNLYYFLDSPIELSNHSVRTWKIKDSHREQTVQIALHHSGSEEDLDVYSAMAQRIVREQKHVYGAYPRFDFGTYTFIADYHRSANGDGMEHRNSTVLTSRRPLDRSSTTNLATLSHEFFHCWNVERLRPRSLEPFDFEQANPSRELWFAEGFTSYYDDLIVHRAGLSNLDEYARGLQSRINTVSNSPGRLIRSAADMSELAVFNDAARSIDPQNTRNTFISYYTFGDAIGLGLDLSLRSRFDKTLDGYMKLVWEKFGSREALYDNFDLVDALGEYTNQQFADEFFRKYVFGHELIPYPTLLAHAGFNLRKEHPGKPYLGPARLNVLNNQILVLDRTRMGSPLYQAGLDMGCKITKLNGSVVKKRSDLVSMLDSFKPGQSVSVEFEDAGASQTTNLILQEDPKLVIHTFENDKMELTKSVLEFRESWLGGKSDFSGIEMHKVCRKCHRTYDMNTKECKDDSERLVFAVGRGSN